MSATCAVTADFLDRSGTTETELVDCVRSLPFELSNLANTLPRPFFAPTKEMVEVAEDTAGIIAILAELPRRFFNGSIDAYLAAQGYGQQMREIMRLGCVGQDISYGRVDAFQSPGGTRAVEINTGSAIAEYKKVKLNELLLRTPRFAEFANQFDLTYVDTIARLAEEITAIGDAVVGRAQPTVAIVEETGCQGLCEWMRGEFQERGFQTVYGELDDLESDRGKVVLHGVRVDVVLRKFFVRHIPGEKNGRDRLRLLRHAHQNGQTALFTAFDSEMHGSKAALGLLYDPAVSAVLSPTERDLVARRIPWTRRLGRVFGLTDTQEHRALLDEVRARRADLILKPAAESGGAGVVYGDEVTDQEWAVLLDRPDRADYVVQERLHPLPQDVIDPESRVRERWHILWQVFFDSQGYAGLSARGRRASEPGVIGGGNPGTQSGCAFTYS
ncbi:hypothetical protein [Actinophytocola sediminis]